MAASARQGTMMRVPFWLRQSSAVATVGVCAVLLLVGVHSYLWLFPSIEASSPSYFERNVADSVAAGNLEKALKIAHRATQVYKPNLLSGKYMDPLPFAVYGDLLLQAGREAEALEQLEKSLSISTVPYPPFRETRKPYYFASARMTLGRFHASRERLVEAAEDFELARAYAGPQDMPKDTDAATLYETYARLGLWERALEYREPSNEELDRLSPQDINCIARTCEGKQNWILAARLAEHLLSRGSWAAEGYYLRGRASMARGQYKEAIADLAQAAADAHACAAFFLGVALERSGKTDDALRAYLAVPSADLYRPFALAMAVPLLADPRKGERDEIPPESAESLLELDQQIAEMQHFVRPVPNDKYLRFKPIAIKTREGSASLGGYFPILILWEDMKAPASDAASLSYSVNGDEATNLSLKRGNSVLQLQWVANLVNWAVIDRLPIGPGPIPGWIDTARDWFKLRPDYAMEIKKEENGNAFLDITRLTWFYSVPVSTDPEVGYVLLGRMAGAGKGNLGWQALEAQERVVDEQLLPGDITPAQWTWEAGYVQSQLTWSEIRVQFNVFPRAGTVYYDDVMLLKLTKP